MIFLAFLATVSTAQDSLSYEEILPTTPSFTTAKKRMYQLYEGREMTFYCQCHYADKVPNLFSCGMGEVDTYRSKRTEAEHVVPASAFGKTRPCWSEGGRSHCLKVDEVFKTFHSDLHNLVPAVGEINGMRSDYGFGMLPGELRNYGDCDFEFNTSDRMVEPTAAVRGDIARIYFYVSWLYGLELSEGQRKLFLSWHVQDPVDDTERERDELIEARQGNSNPFVR